MEGSFGYSTHLAYPVLLRETGTHFGIQTTARCDAEHYLAVKRVHLWANFKPKLSKGRATKTVYVTTNSLIIVKGLQQYEVKKYVFHPKIRAIYTKGLGPNANQAAMPVTPAEPPLPV